HLNTGWLDKQTGKMRPELRDRMAAIASRNVWLATASAMLDRFECLKHVRLTTDGRSLSVINEGDRFIERLTLVSPNGQALLKEGQALSSDKRNRVVVGDIGPREKMVLGLAN